MELRGSILLLSWVLATVGNTAAQRYIVTDLGPLSPTGINSWAQVTGNSNDQGYVWTLGRMRAIGRLPQGTFSHATAINDLGMVAGTADGAGTATSVFASQADTICSAGLVQPFVWTAANGLRGLGTLKVPGANYPYIDACDGQFYATALNNKGEVAGYTRQFPDLFQWGFSWSRTAGMRYFGSSWAPTYVLGINDGAEMVGEDRTHATTWKGNVATSLAPLAVDDMPGLYVGSANDVNERGQVVGWSTVMPSGVDGCYDTSIYDPEEPGTPHCTIHAALWAGDGTATDLGTLGNDTLSAANKVNRFGLVIGMSGNSAVYGDGASPRGPIKVVGRPFLWSKQAGMRDLNTLIPKKSGWVLQTATAINVWGQIVGSGMRNGQTHGYLLTPVNPFQVY